MKEYIQWFKKTPIFKKFYLIFIIVISAVAIFHRLGEAPLAGDDCYFSEKAKEMARTGDFLTLRYGYEFSFDNKPPFIFWMNSLSGRILGFNNFSMRLGSAILCFLCVIVTFMFTSKIFDDITGFFSAIVLTFTQQYLYHARSAVTDGPLAAFMAFALFSFFIAEYYDKPKFYYLMGLFTGMAVMTKQVNGLLVYAVVVVYSLITKRYKMYSSLHFYGGVILSAIIFLPWHIWSIITHGKDFVDSYFGTIVRHGITGIKGRPEDPWYQHIRKIIENYWPWLPFLVMALVDGIKIVFKQKDVQEDYRNKIIFILSWALVPFMVFQLGRVKATQNLNPIYVAFSILVATKLRNINENTKNKVFTALVVVSIFTAVLFLAVPIIPKTMDSREYSDYLPILPQLKQVYCPIYTLNDTFWYFSNATWFYADKRVIGLTEEELVERIMSDKKHYFLLFNNDFFRVKKKVPAYKLKIIKATKKVVLFSNC